MSRLDGTRHSFETMFERPLVTIVLKGWCSLVQLLFELSSLVGQISQPFAGGILLSCMQNFDTEEECKKNEPTVKQRQQVNNTYI